MNTFYCINEQMNEGRARQEWYTLQRHGHSWNDLRVEGETDAKLKRNIEDGLSSRLRGQGLMTWTAICESKLNFQLWQGQSGVTCTPGFMCLGLCGTFCFPCLGCQVAADMNECCLCGTSVAMRTLYRTRYGIPVSLLPYHLTQICNHIQNNYYKPRDHLMYASSEIDW